MPVWRTFAGLLTLGVVFGAAAQGPASDPGADSTSEGRLVLWIVHTTPLTPLQQAVAQLSHSVPDSIQSQTAGSFGQTASSYGQTAGSYGRPSSDDHRNASDNSPTAGSYGQPAGSFGTPSSSTGETAGSYGQTAGSLGTSSSNVGQTAGSYGQTAGSVGESLSTLNEAATRTQRAAERAFHHPAHTVQWDSWIGKVHTVFPQIELSVVDVREDELQAELDAARGTSNYPDLLLGKPLPASWSRPDTGLVRQYGITLLHSAVRVQLADVTPPRSEARPWNPDASLLIRASHPAAARAVMLWLLDGSDCFACRAPMAVTSNSPGEVAARALYGVLMGQDISGEADPEMARFAPDAARVEAFGTNSIPPKLNVHVDVMDAPANDRLAAVAMRATVSTANAFGEMNAFAVLRIGADGRWRVLQITPSMQADYVDAAVGWLHPFAQAQTAAQVKGVSLASPADGDNRPPQPELWWDNRGGAGLQVVEWQLRAGGRSAGSHLYFVPDANMLLRTRVTAPFLNAGAYRWRVWSVGTGGMLALSPWRSVNIVQ